MEDEIDSCIRAFLRVTPKTCKEKNIDAALYFQIILKGLKRGDDTDKEVGVRLARVLYDKKILNLPS